MCEDAASFILATMELDRVHPPNQSREDFLKEKIKAINEEFFKPGCYYQITLSPSTDGALREALQPLIGRVRPKARGKTHKKRTEFLPYLSPLPENEVIPEKGNSASWVERVLTLMYAACEEMEELLTAKVTNMYLCHNPPYDTSVVASLLFNARILGSHKPPFQC